MKDRLQDLQQVCSDKKSLHSRSNSGSSTFDSKSSSSDHQNQTEKNNNKPPMWYDGETEPDVKEVSPVLAQKANNQRMVSTMDTLLRRNLSPRKFQRKDEEIRTAIKHQVEKIRENVTTMQGATRELRELHTNALISPKLSEDDRNNMTELDEKVRAASLLATKKIKALEKLDVPTGSVNHRMHSAQLTHIRRTFSKAMEGHESELQRYATGLRKIVTREIMISKGKDGSDAEVNDCMEDGRGHQIFIDNYQKQELEARKIFEDVSDRYDELAEIEKSVVEVHNLFNSIAVLISNQGDVLDSIEMHVLAAVDLADEGGSQLKTAKTKKGAARKKKMTLAGVGTALGVGLVATLSLL